jgi:hypothetical protein
MIYLSSLNQELIITKNTNLELEKKKVDNEKQLKELNYHLQQ